MLHINVAVFPACHIKATEKVIYFACQPKPSVLFSIKRRQTKSCRNITEYIFLKRKNIAAVQESGLNSDIRIERKRQLVVPFWQTRRFVENGRVEKFCGGFFCRCVSEQKSPEMHRPFISAPAPFFFTSHLVSFQISKQFATNILNGLRGSFGVRLSAALLPITHALL